MQKQLLLFIVLLIVSIALLGCTDIGSGEINIAITNEPQITVQAGEVAAESKETASESNESDTDDQATIVNTLIQLSDPLDEPEYYCIDVPGFGQSLNLDGALTAHTCKPNADDELFTINFPAEGQFYMPAYERCMEARAAEASTELTMMQCNDSPLQQFAYHNNGTIQLQSSDSEALCIAVADEAGEPTGGPSHLRRNLMLQPCASVSTALSQWVFPEANVIYQSND